MSYGKKNVLKNLLGISRIEQSLQIQFHIAACTLGASLSFFLNLFDALILLLTEKCLLAPASWSKKICRGNGYHLRSMWKQNYDLNNNWKLFV